MLTIMYGAGGGRVRGGSRSRRLSNRLKLIDSIFVLEQLGVNTGKAHQFGQSAVPFFCSDVHRSLSTEQPE